MKIDLSGRKGLCQSLQRRKDVNKLTSDRPLFRDKPPGRNDRIDGKHRNNNVKIGYASLDSQSWRVDL